MRMDEHFLFVCLFFAYHSFNNVLIQNNLFLGGEKNADMKFCQDKQEAHLPMVYLARSGKL